MSTHVVSQPSDCGAKTTRARVAVAKATAPAYPVEAPYHPEELYPEYPFGEAAVSTVANPAYTAVRQAFHGYGLDGENFGTRAWNPLGEIVRPGDRVVIKPNFVLHHNAAGHGLEPVVTHPSVLRAVADYVFLALRGDGSVTIADAPQADCDFHALAEWAHLADLQQFYHSVGAHLDVLDLRKLRVRPRGAGLVLSGDREYRDGDPRGYVTVDLKADSQMGRLPNVERLYGSDYDRTETVQHHVGGRHEYFVARTILDANVIINVPKMKVHKKVGVTLNLKNLVGINGDKNYLPHFRVGSPTQGGDAYPDTMNARGKKVVAVRTWLLHHLLGRGGRVGDWLFLAIHKTYRALRDGLGIQVDKPVDAGNWYGNDTCWRMTVDLNTILFFADAEGQIQPTPQRRYWSVVDGIIGGDLGGPLAPDPVPSGLVVTGGNPLAVDCAVARLMGFDWRKIPQLALLQAAESSHPLARQFRLSAMEDLDASSDDPEIAAMMTHARRVARPYRPHPGWAGHIEMNPAMISQPSE